MDPISKAILASANGGEALADLKPKKHGRKRGPRPLVEAVRRGEKVVGCVGPDNARVEYEVLPPCQDKGGGQWWCVTHDLHFTNNFQKDGHIGRGRHRLAWVCFAHGPEEP